MLGKICMYMVTHKPVNYIPRGRTPIFVGNGVNSEGYLADNTEDNISLKNKYYCELTAYYWIWKNDKSSEYISIEHYRRFFMKKCLFPRLLSVNDMEKFAKKRMIVSTTFKRSRLSIWDFYCARHYQEDIELVKKRIKECFPEYEDTFNRIMKSHSGPMYNMVAMPKDAFDEYCKWLFDLLFYVEKETEDLEQRTPYQQRAFGFLAERLLNVWIDYSNLSRKKRPVYYWESNRLFAFARSIKKRLPLAYNPSGPRG